MKAKSPVKTAVASVSNLSSRVRYTFLPLALGATLLAGGCATRTTGSGGRETTVLGGAVTVSTDSFQPPTPTAAIDVDTTKLVGKGDPSGKKISILWGLINLHDY